MNAVFAVLLPDEDRLSAEEQALFDERQEARRQRDFARGRLARQQLEALGIVLEDTPEGHAMAAKALSGLLAPAAARPGGRARTWPAAILAESGYRDPARATSAAASGSWTWSRAGGASPCSSRSRSGTAAATAQGFESVTFGKRRRVLRAARLYAARTACSRAALRFDVISIDWEDGRKPRQDPPRREGAFDAAAG